MGASLEPLDVPENCDLYSTCSHLAEKGRTRYDINHRFLKKTTPTGGSLAPFIFTFYMVYTNGIKSVKKHCGTFTACLPQTSTRLPSLANCNQKHGSVSEVPLRQPQSQHRPEHQPRHLVVTIRHIRCVCLCCGLYGHFRGDNVQFGHLILVCIKYDALQEITCCLFRKISHSS